MGRSPCCDKNGLKKGPWTPEEDAKLIQYIEAHGAGNWRNLPKNAGLQRCGKSCRLRWTNYLRPDIKRGRFSFEEEETIIQLHSALGNKWSAIAERLPGRTDNEIKNYWNTHIRKRLLRMGIDPVTHAPRLDLLDLSSLLHSPQLNLQSLIRLQTLLNPDALRLAMSLTSSSSNAAPDCNQLLQHQNQIMGGSGTPPILPNHFQNIIDQPIPPNINNKYNNSFQNQTTQTLQDDHFIPHTNATDHQSCLLPADFCYGVSDQKTAADLSENSSFDQSMNSHSNSSNNSHGFCSFDSVVSTPLSSPPMLNKSLITGGGEDDTQIFNDLFRFEIPESLNFDDFM